MISGLVMTQGEGYILCLVSGLVMGVIGSAMHLMQQLLKKTKWVAWMGDIALWLALSVIIIGLNWACCDGRIRLYIFLGFFSGYLFSYYTINGVVSKIATYILCKKKHD